MKKLLCVLGLTTLAACQAVTPQKPGPAPAADTCGAALFQGLVGQPGTSLRSLELPKGTRVIGPRDAVTMDYRQERLNFEIGADGRIAKISCY